MTLSEELQWRGFVNQTTYPELTALDGGPITFYWGVDPSADSMTIGNLAAAMLVKAFIKHGHKPVLLIGGATGLIGDPDGKAQERDLKTPEEIDRNSQTIVAQYAQIFQSSDYQVVNNRDWFQDIKYLDFLRDIGKHVPMRQMLGRDFVQSRLGEQGAGISYAEFSYVLIQAYDFLHLYKEAGVTLQLCGADQWGNSVAGVDLIRRKTGAEAQVFSTPLVVNKATGKKFGKSEAGAVWLDAAKTSPFQFYQFWLNVDDDSVEDYLKIFTELDQPAVESTMQEFEHDRGGRAAQKALAYEVTKLVHGSEQAERIQRASAVLFGGGDFRALSAEEAAVLKQELPVVQAGGGLAAVVVAAGLAASNSEAMRFIRAGAISVNGQKVDGAAADPFQAGDNLLKRGKNNFAVVEKSQ
ncbi:MAG TPA: tyrosine--tRNA ligase [Candidatus Saccharimonadales bacterium]|nr:tyrosine--tRNA ligase [Candidatus Saccharimonadales bacterium]